MRFVTFWAAIIINDGVVSLKRAGHMSCQELKIPQQKYLGMVFK